MFFVDLHDPWIFFWMYTGTVMRLALCVEPSTSARRRAGSGWCATAYPRDAFGWTLRQDAGAMIRRICIVGLDCYGTAVG